MTLSGAEARAAAEEEASEEEERVPAPAVPALSVRGSRAEVEPAADSGAEGAEVLSLPPESLPLAL
jgi:hypothetical protein